MIDYFRSLFGIRPSASKRTVVGYHQPVNIKNVAYLKASKDRLNLLYHLYKRYENTPHGAKVEAVYQKTKEIHEYFVSRDRLQELEIFHIQHTEHFINTFRAIKDAHDSQAGLPPTPAKPKFKEEKPYKTPPHVQFKQKEMNGKEPAQKAGPIPGNSTTLVKEADEAAPLSIPEVSINTFQKIPVIVNSQSALLPDAEIGFTSTEQEKEGFLAYVTARLGIQNLSYLGNAQVHFPDSNSRGDREFAPVIHWKGSLYALNLEDFRLFPVKIYRRRS